MSSKVKEDTASLDTRLVLGRCRLVDTKLVPLVLEYIGDTYVPVAAVHTGTVWGAKCGIDATCAAPPRHPQ